MSNQTTILGNDLNTKSRRTNDLANKYSTCTNQKCAVGTEIKFRAECDLDALLFMRLLMNYVQQPWLMVSEYSEPDVTFRLKEDISIDDLRWVASVIPDAHVIVQTLATSKDYSGQRDNSLQIDVLDKRLMPPAKVLANIVNYSRNSAKFTKVLASAAEDLSKELAKLYELSGYPKESIDNTAR